MSRRRRSQTRCLRHGAQLIPLRQQKMPREIRRASDNATCFAVRRELVAKGYGEWPKLMFEHRAKGSIKARYDPCFFAAPTDKIVCLAAVGIPEEINIDEIIVGYGVDEPCGDPEIIACTERAFAQPSFDIPPKSPMP